MATTPHSPERREAARRALAGEERYAGLQQKAAALAKQRQTASRVMESNEQRARREAKDKLARQRETAAATKAKQAADLEAAAKAKETQASEAARQREQAKTAATQTRKAEIVEKEKTIEEIKSASSGLSPIRTYKSDFAQAVKQDEVSVAKMALAEQNKRLAQAESAPVVTPSKRGHPILVVLFTLILLVIVGGLGYLVWQQPPVNSPEGETLTNPPEAPILIEESLALELPPAEPGAGLLALDQAIAELSPQRQITQIYFTRQGQNLNIFSSATVLGLKLPDRIARNLEPDFTFGVYNDGQIQSRFLMLNLKNFDPVYAAALDWEKTLPEDSLGLLHDGNQLNTVAGLAFSDQRLRNIDLRLVNDNAGQTFLVYAFLDANTLLLTTNQATFLEILGRFTNSPAML